MRGLKNTRKRSPSQRLKLLILSAFFSIVCAFFAQLSFPSPWGVPFTLQTFAVSLCGFVLPPLYAFLSIFLYLFLGVIGIPVFSAFSGGISAFFSFGGGFLLGFVFLCLFCSFSRFIRFKFLSFLLALFGLVLCHLSGILWFSFVTKQDFLPCFLTASLPFLLKDILSVLLSFCLFPLILKKIKNV